MKKLIFASIFILFFSGVCFAEDSPRLYFPSKHQNTSSVYPVDSSVGVIVSPEKSPAHTIVSQALKETFDFDWTEKYLHEETKNAVAKIVSPLFSELLPCKEFVLSQAMENGDQSISVAAHLLSEDVTVSFVIKDDKIFGVSIGK